MRIWIDIENPPQVQYLLPFKRAFEQLGAEVLVTARDYGFTFDLLREEGVRFEPVAASYGKGRARKALGVVARTNELLRVVRRGARPAVLVCAGRASALAARRLGVPSFILGDYEYVHQSLYRLTRSYLVYPDVIDAEVFTGQGIAPERLLAYRGLKEDLTFAGLDVEAVSAHRFSGVNEARLAKVLFRPPAVESHYYLERSGSMSARTLEHLAALEDVVTIFSPRYSWQVQDLERLSWRNAPIVLEDPVPFVSLLKGVDAVVSAGGTMLREAAYLGVPAYSIFQGAPGGVDRHLESLGRLRVLSSPEDLEQLAFEPRSPCTPLPDANPRLLDELVVQILDRAGVRPVARGRAAAPCRSYGVVTPARNEAERLPQLAACLAGQTLPPAGWVIVDNGSSDRTVEVAEALGREDPSIRVLSVEGESVPTRGGPVARAFSAGLDALGPLPDVVVKVDADVTFDSDYFERLLGEFAADSSLGIGGGTCYELEQGEWRPRHVTGGRVRGATRAYRRECLLDVLPLENRPGWDGIDELRALAQGWTTASFAHLHFRHHREVGARDASRRSQLFKTGRATYYTGYRPSYLVLRALFRARREPIAVAMIAGYLYAAARRDPRCEDPAIRDYMRREQSLRRLPKRAREALGRRPRDPAPARATP
jgi:poly-beta-1,6-N-acetyl-D-glucosamine synthase